jgi:hypothetical protein
VWVIEETRHKRKTWWELFPTVIRNYRKRKKKEMKAYFTNLPTKTWLLLVVPALLIAYPVGRVVVPEVVNAVVPEVVRTVLSVI